MFARNRDPVCLVPCGCRRHLWLRQCPDTRSRRARTAAAAKAGDDGAGKRKKASGKAAFRRKAIAVTRQGDGDRLLPARLSLPAASNCRSTGPTWQVMRLSRNRNWGHPSLINFLEKFAPLAAKATGWKGILVGDLAQPRGGPSPSDHASHQIGLDVDIWFMPMPDHVLSKEERDNISAINLVSDDWKHLNPKTWTPQHVAFIKTAAAAARGRARAGQRRDQEGIVPRRRQSARRLDGEGAALVRPPRPHPCAAEMPGRFAELPRATAGAGR